MNTKPLFSIIVPVYNEQKMIGPCLDMITDCERSDEVEVIVVDGGGGSTVSVIKQEKRPYPLITLESLQGRGVQMNVGAKKATGRILIFLHVDSRLPRNAPSCIEKALHTYRAGCFSLKIDTDHPFLWIGCMLANLRARYMGIPYGDQTYFIERELFFEIGGFPELPIMEDVAFMLELKRRKVKPIVLKEKSVTSNRRWMKEGVYRGTFRNWSLFLRYRLGTPAQKLAQKYPPHNMP